jgi:mevalonate kinase
MINRVPNYTTQIPDNLQGDGQSTSASKFKDKLKQCIERTDLINKHKLSNNLNYCQGNDVQCLLYALERLDKAGYYFAGCLRNVWEILKYSSEKDLESANGLAQQIQQISNMWNHNVSFKVNGKTISLTEEFSIIDASSSYFPKKSELPNSTQSLDNITSTSGMENLLELLHQNEKLLQTLNVKIDLLPTNGKLSGNTINLINSFIQQQQQNYNQVLERYLSNNTIINDKQFRQKVESNVKSLKDFNDQLNELNNLENSLQENQSFTQEPNSMKIEAANLSSQVTNAAGYTNSDQPANYTASYLHQETEPSHKKLRSSEENYSMPQSQAMPLSNAKHSDDLTAKYIIKYNCKQLKQLENEVNRKRGSKLFKFNEKNKSLNSMEEVPEITAIKPLMIRINQELVRNLQFMAQYKQDSSKKFDYNFYLATCESSKVVAKLTKEVYRQLGALKIKSNNGQPMVKNERIIPERIEHSEDFIIDLTDKNLAKIQDQVAGFIEQNPGIINRSLNGLTTAHLISPSEAPQSNSIVKRKDSPATQTTPSITQNSSLSNEDSMLIEESNHNSGNIVTIWGYQQIPEKVIENTINKAFDKIKENAEKSIPLKLENFFLVEPLKKKQDKKTIFNKLLAEALYEYSRDNKIQYKFLKGSSKIWDNTLKATNKKIFCKLQEWLNENHHELASAKYTIVEPDSLLSNTPDFKSYLKLLSDLMQADNLSQAQLLDQLNTKVISEYSNKFPYIITLQTLMKIKQEFLNNSK